MPVSKKVAIVGLGAIGAYFAERFLSLESLHTCAVAAGERYAKLEREGICINGKQLAVPLQRADEKAAPADLILVALKHQHLDAGLSDLENLVGEKTTIVSFMNGIDSEAIIASRYGAERVLYGISLGIDSVRVGQRIDYSNPGRHIFGAADNRQPDARVLAVQQLFQQAGIAYETPDDMLRWLWWKFMINVGVNQTSAVMRANYGVIQTSAVAQELMFSLMQEVVTLAQNEKVPLTQEDLTHWLPILNTLAPQGKTSMLQDIEAGRKTEVDIFAGKVLQLAQKHGVETPVNRIVGQIIQGLEESF